jgi:hypothetical protein
MKIYVLMREVDLIGVYRSEADALAVAIKYDLFNYTIEETELE